MPIIVFFITLNPLSVLLVPDAFSAEWLHFIIRPISGSASVFDAMLRAPRAEFASKAIIPLRSSGMTETEMVWNARVADARFSGVPDQNLIADSKTQSRPRPHRSRPPNESNRNCADKACAVCVAPHRAAHYG
jgi:hypothetical protein